MATIPVYTTWVAGTVVTASQMNSNIRDAGNFFLARPYCDVSRSTTQALTSTLTVVPYDTENEDNDGMHSTTTNPSRVICQTPGLYSIHPYFRTTAAVVGTLNIRLNAAGSNGGGSTLSTSTYDTSTNQCERYLTYRYVNIGDYIEMFAAASSGNAGGGNRVTGFTALWEIA